MTSLGQPERVTQNRGIGLFRDKRRVRLERFFVQRMKTRWGGCNHTVGTIRLNTELAKKPAECLEYILVSELNYLQIKES